jgi:hypothetical protein
MKNQVIKVLTPEHGKKVIEYWKSRGIFTRGLVGCKSAADGESCIYYGVIDNGFSSYNLETVRSSNTEIITLPEENPYPKVMWVWDAFPENKVKRVVFMKKCGEYLAWEKASTIEQANQTTDVHSWSNACDINDTITIELTRSELGCIIKALPDHKELINKLNSL